MIHRLRARSLTVLHIHSFSIRRAIACRCESGLVRPESSNGSRRQWVALGFFDWRYRAISSIGANHPKEAKGVSIISKDAS
jgi:hypothetical protein